MTERNPQGLRGATGQSEQSTATSRAAQMARIRMSASRPSLLTSTGSETLSTESRFTAERRGSGRNQAQEGPRWQFRGWSSCTVRQVPVEAEESPRYERAQRLGAGRSQPSRTTRPLRAPGVLSRGASHPPPRRQIAPLVRFINWMLVIGRVARIELCRPISSQQRRQRLVNESRIGDT
jgi:hypothetical protein